MPRARKGRRRRGRQSRTTPTSATAATPTPDVDLFLSKRPPPPPILKQFLLPDLAINEILGSLNVHALEQLRLVSREFNEWVAVGNWNHLEKFKIYIRSQYDLNKWLGSSVPWSNFVFTINLTEPFVKRFGPHLKHLTLKHTAVHIELLLSTLSSNIQTMHFGEHCLYVDEEPSEETRAKWRENLWNLKEFSVEGIYHLDPLPFDVTKLGNKSFLFDAILNSCSQNLVHLKLPWLLNMRMRTELSSKDGVVFDVAHKKKLLRKFVVEPLFNFLRRFDNNSSKLQIDFVKGCAKFLINEEDLLDLARDCSRTGARLLNIPMDALPTNWVTADQRVLAKSVLSVKICSSANLNAYVPATSKLNVLILHPSHFSSGALPSAVRSLEVNCVHYGIPNPDLFQGQRLTMEELRLVGGRKDSTAADICQNFPNLRKIELAAWRHDEDFNVLFRGLPLLTHLKLESCFNLTDLGIIGPDRENPLILQLTHLTHLEMKRMEITNEPFTLAFRHMKLRTFKWTKHHFCDVTFEGGFSSLATIDGGFKDSIEILEVTRPINSPETLNWFVTSSFPNLQHFKFHEW